MRRAGIVALVGILLAVSGLVAVRLRGLKAAGGEVQRAQAAAVEVAAVEKGPIERLRLFTGSLEARGRFVVAASVGGRVERLFVDLADQVEKGQVVAKLDNAEHAATVAEASAELAVVQANLVEAESALEIAERELKRIESLHGRGLVPDSELDAAKARHLARRTGVKVANAQLSQAGAAQRRARVRSSYTNVIASWSGADPERVVAERHVAEGDTVAPNAPLITVVELDPLLAVVHVTEHDYGLLRAKQPASLTTEVYPGKRFDGVIRRIAPVFRTSSRQARMELEVANPDGLLKPGMFVRAEIVLARADNAAIVPLAALATRQGKTGVFVVNDAGSHVTWHPVELGIEQGDRVQLLGKGIEGRVVTLGHQLIDDGAAITIPKSGTRAPEGS